METVINLAEVYEISLTVMERSLISWLLRDGGIRVGREGAVMVSRIIAELELEGQDGRLGEVDRSFKLSGYEISLLMSALESTFESEAIPAFFATTALVLEGKFTGVESGK